MGSTYRLNWPGHAVAAHQPDWDVDVVDPTVRELRVDISFYDPTVVTGEGFPADADLVVFQRPTLSILVGAIPLLRRRGVAVVVDMDDDMGRIHPNNPAFASLRKVVPHSVTGHPIQNQHSARHAARCCALATMVTVSTPQLASVYPNTQGAGTVVIPNFVPARFLAVPHVDSDLVGWGGAVHSHPTDLQVMGPTVVQHLADGGRFRTVGQKDRVAEVLGLGDVEPDGPGPVDLDTWPSAIGEFGIGLAPLDVDTLFNKAKSRLKPLEYNAVGVPCVASPSAEYRGWAAESAGTVIARRPREWRGIVRALVADPARRREMSEAGREAARANTIEGNAWRWAEVWQAAVDYQRGLGARASEATAGAQ